MEREIDRFFFWFRFFIDRRSTDDRWSTKSDVEGISDDCLGDDRVRGPTDGLPYPFLALVIDVEQTAEAAREMCLLQV